MMFEAGAFSNKKGKTNICSILFEIGPADLIGPLAIFQNTIFEKYEIKQLMFLINELLNVDKLKEEMLNDVFTVWWPHLEKEIQVITENYKSGKLASGNIKRSERDMLEEILELTRSNLFNQKPRVEDSIYTDKTYESLSQDDINVLDQHIRETLLNLKETGEEIENQPEKIFSEMNYFDSVKTASGNPDNLRKFISEYFKNSPD